MTKFIDCSHEAKETKKETIFTHSLSSREGYIETKNLSDMFEKVIYLGKCAFDGDMFACYSGTGSISVYKGIKGDEFNL